MIERYGIQSNENYIKTFISKDYFNTYVLTNFDLEYVPVYTLTDGGKLVEDNNIDKEALYNILNELNEGIQPFLILLHNSGELIKVTSIKNSTINHIEDIVVLGTLISFMSVFVATKKIIRRVFMETSSCCIS